MHTVNNFQLGLRVRYAREALGLSQEQLKAKLGLKDRQTISDIEKGKRTLKAAELVQMADVLDKDIPFFLDPFSVVAESRYCWRVSPALPRDELDRCEVVASGWLGLLRWLREEHKAAPEPLKHVLRLNAGSSVELAARQAEQLARTALGPAPAEALVEFVERELGIVVLFVDFGDQVPAGAISGATCTLGELGDAGELTAILINRRLPAAHQSLDLAHGVFNCLTWDAMPPEHREPNTADPLTGMVRRERLAHAFATSLLMPTHVLDAHIDPARAADVPHLAGVAARLRVSGEALSWRLAQLQRIDSETQWALAGWPGPAEDTSVPSLFSEAFVRMLHVALDRGWLSARKAATTLGMTLSGLDGLFAAHEMPSPFEL